MRATSGRRWRTESLSVNLYDVLIAVVAPMALRSLVLGLFSSWDFVYGSQQQVQHTGTVAGPAASWHRGSSSIFMPPRGKRVPQAAPSGRSPVLQRPATGVKWRVHRVVDAMQHQKDATDQFALDLRQSARWFAQAASLLVQQRCKWDSV